MNRRHFIAQAAAVAPLFAAGTEKIQIAFLGGSHSHALAKAKVLKDSADFTLVGIWEEDGKTQAKYSALGVKPMTVDAILGDKQIPVVAVQSAVGDHGKHALMALRAGKHVHVEKPPATNMEDFKQMVELAREKSLLLQTGYMWRYNPGFVTAIEAARTGVLGDIYQLHGVMNTLLAPARRPDWGQFKGGQMFEQGGYMVDAMVRLLGRPDKVTPFLHRHGKFDDNLMDNTVAVLEFPNALGVIRSSALQPSAAMHRAFEIQGTNGTALVGPIEPPALQIDLQKPAGPYKAGKQQVELPPYVRFKEDFVELAAAIRGEKKLSVSLAEELLTQETLMRACKV